MEKMHIHVELETEKQGLVVYDKQGIIESDNYLDVTCLNNHVSIKLKGEEKVRVKCAYVDFNYDFKKEDRLFLNGYQTWTTSKECSINDKMIGTQRVPRFIMKRYNPDKYGDYFFYNYKNKKGYLHGYTYGYIKDKNNFILIGSINDKNAFTRIIFDCKSNKVVVESDCAGVVKNKFTLLDFYILNGQEEKVFNDYFELLNASSKAKSLFGYCSWYNHYQNISESKINDNLNSIGKVKNDLFQIDDGYQTFVGDWQSIDKVKFPDGLKQIVDNIHSKNMLAGLWLAPFVCEEKSDIFINHNDWIARYKDNSLIRAGGNWSGFYLLDLKKKEVLDYIEQCFDVVLNKWGFDFVKLDFLYAAALTNDEDETRGEVMAKACDFLRNCVKDKLILGCGVPLASCFSTFDYCRIGCDVSLNYKGDWWARWVNNEIVSTKNSITNSIFRRQLNNNVFVNDPDVFLLRSDNIKLTLNQKKALAIINVIFGGLYLTSDNISLYDNQMHKFYNDLRKYQNAKVLNVRSTKDNIYIQVEVNKKQIELNLSVNKGIFVDNNIR